MISFKICPPIQLIFILFISLSFNLVNAQIEKDTLQAWEYYQKADSLFEKRDFKNAIPKLKKAISIYKKIEAWKQVARSYNQIVKNYRETADSKNMLININKAFDISSTKLSTPNEEQADAYYNLGRYSLFISSFKEGLANFEKALDLLNQISLDKSRKSVLTLDQIGVAHLRLGNFEKAKASLEKAIYIAKNDYDLHKKNIGKLFLTYALIHDYSKEYEKAIDLYNTALEIQIKEYGENHQNLIVIYNNLGVVNYLLFEVDKALFFYEKTLALKEKILYENHISILRTKENIALVYLSNGEYKKALDYFINVLSAKEKTILNERYLAPTYDYLGLTYHAIGNLDKALDFKKKALLIFTNVFSENHYRVMEEHTGIGSLYISKKDYKKAKFHFNKAIHINSVLFKTANKTPLGTYSGLANAFLGLKDFDSAIENYQIELENRIKLYGEKHPFAAATLNDIGSLYFKKKEFKKALAYYEKSLTILNQKDKKESQIKIYKSGNGDYLLQTLASISNIHLQLYLKNNGINDLNKSITTYKKAEKRIDTLKQIFTRYEDRLEFSKIGEEIYPSSIRANYLLNTKKENIETLKKAFYYSEKSHADVLEEILSASKAKQFSGLSDSLVNLESTLKSRRAYYQSRITEEQDKEKADSTVLASFEDKLFTINRRYDSLTEVFQKDYPKYHQLKYDHAVISVSQVQQKLNDNTTLLEYFTADSLTYAFVISKNKFDVKELSTDSLLAKVEQQRNALSQKNLVSYKKMSRTLYQELISPIADLLVGEHLIIVPDGPLWHLNFDLLLSKDTDSRNPQQLPYLLNTYAISYANSANLLFNRPDFDKSKVLNQALAFSYADTTALADGNVMRLGTLRDAGEDLPGTRKEIKAISDIVDGVYYYGKEAVEANFKKDADRYGIVHLALHGEVDNENPQNSKLFFTKSNDTIEDNLLYSHELFALHVPAELTVLSACNTGTGKIAKGEGIMSLGNAFQYAGTKSLLLSSWEVADDTAPELMKYFYANLKEGMSKPKALQQAKLEYLKTADPARSNPFYWGNFYIVGDPKPISLDSNFSYWYWILGAIALIGIGGSLWYRKRRMAA
ncbi:CHAT domain-containing protein [Flavobacteriaceae bacterium R38]|nr:CHAT domain-containing protein [Flavobacteriaceae bacterium R38]